MHRQANGRGPVRRTVLTAGLGLFAAVASGCGLRLDRDPAMPELSPVDVLRDAVARSFAATTADGVAAEAIAVLSAAVGPPWDPPDGLAEPVAPPNPDPGPLTAAEGLADAARRVVDASPQLGRGTGPTGVVLADVAVGALLHLDAVDAEAAAAIRADIAPAMRAALDAVEADAAGAAAATPPAPGASADGRADGEDEHPLVGLVTASHIAEYAYERAAVHLPEDSAARRGAHARLDGLSGVAAIAPTLADGVTVPSNRPAWELDPRPEDAATALAALRAAEDALLAQVWRARGSIPPAVLLSWSDDSARARERADGFQDLRFEVGRRRPEEDG